MRSYAKRQSLAICEWERGGASYPRVPHEKPREIVWCVIWGHTGSLLDRAFPWLRTSPHDHSHITTNPGPAPTSDEHPAWVQRTVSRRE
jgi:hypothetical protein